MLMITPAASAAWVMTSPTTEHHPDQRHGTPSDRPAQPDPFDGMTGRELRVLGVQCTLDFVEPALLVLGERHGSFPAHN